jgi:hypothetical protein
MSLMTLAPATTGDQPEPGSYEQGYLDGQLAALTRLSSRRAHARAAMAQPYDPAYAEGYLDGFDHQTDLNAQKRFNTILNAFQESR